MWKGGDCTDRYIIVKIAEPPIGAAKLFEIAMGTHRYEGKKTHGLTADGPLFEGTHTVAVVSSEYMLELICRVLTAARVPYSVEQGRPIRKKKKSCGTSTSFTLEMISITAELQSSPTEDCGRTTPANAEQQPDDSGNE